MPSITLHPLHPVLMVFTTEIWVELSSTIFLKIGSQFVLAKEALGLSNEAYLSVFIPAIRVSASVRIDFAEASSSANASV